MKCFYHNDLDGRCSAAIVSAWVGIKPPDHRSVKVGNANIRVFDSIPPCEFIEMDYSRPVPFDKIAKDEQVWIVDFSFKQPDMMILRDITKDITWIDHHKTAIESLKEFELAGYRRIDQAACVLTWAYVHWYSRRGADVVTVNPATTKIVPKNADTLIPIPRCVAMIGDYDAWLHKIPDSTAFYEGCKMLPFQNDPSDLGWFDMLVGEQNGKYGNGKPLPKKDVCSPIIERGKSAISYRDAYCKEMCDQFGYEYVLDGHIVWVTNIYKFGSMGFGDRMKRYDICAACVYDGRAWTISLYSDKPDINVGEICKKHGGGGHKGAAGFISKEWPFSRP